MPSLDYSGYNYDVAKVQLEAKLVGTGTWKDRVKSATGQIFVSLISYLIDMDGYKIDRRARENTRRFARLRTSIVELAYNIGYVARRKVSSVCTLRFETSSPPVIIPIGTIVSSSGGVRFVTTEGGTITGQSIDLAAKQGNPKEFNFTSTGTVFQKFTIPASGDNVEAVENESVVVKVDGTTWTEVDSFVGQNTEDQVYTLTRKGSSLLITFGDGNNGKIPPEDLAIDIEWLETLGSAGDVPTIGSISSIVSEGFSGVTVSNIDSAQGGEDEENIEEIRDNMAQVFATGDRAVTASDYRAILLAYPGVAKANAYGEQEVLTGASNPDYAWRVVLVVVPSSGGTLTRTQEELIAAFLETKKVVTSYITFEDPVYIPIDFVVRAIVNSDYTLQEGFDAIDTALDGLTAFQDVDLGEGLRYGDVVNVIESLTEIQSSIIDVFATKDAGTGTGSKTVFASTDAGIGAIPLTPIDRDNVLIYLENLTDGSRRRVGYDDGSGNLTSSSLIASPRITSGSVDYSDGTFSITFDTDPSSNYKVVIRYQTGVPDSATIGVGDGAEDTFTAVIERNLSKGFIQILLEGTVIGEDDGSGNIVNVAGSSLIQDGEVNYATGDIQVEFVSPPDVDLEITSDFYYENQDILVSLSQMIVSGKKDIDVESAV